MSGRLMGVLVTTFALLAAGLSTGTRIYYLIFAILALTVVLGLIATLWMLWSIQVDIKDKRARVTRKETLSIVFAVRHMSFLPVASVRMQLNTPSMMVQELNISMPPFVWRTFRQTMQCPHRGIYKVGVEKITVCDVFGLFSISRKVKAEPMRVEILPKLQSASQMPLKITDIGPEFRMRTLEDTASPSDVRTWQEGDSLKKVHWKLSMRRREVMVRTYEESTRPDTLIIPDLSEIAMPRDQQLSAEDCICEACLAVAKTQLDAGFPVRMPLMSTQPSEVAGQTPADLPGFIDALLRVQFDSLYAYEKVLMLMSSRLQRTGGMVLISTHLTTCTADVALRMQRSGICTRLIWISDSPAPEELQLIERLKMEGVQATQIGLLRKRRSGDAVP